jgi:hypothetical protein
MKYFYTRLFFAIILLLLYLWLWLFSSLYDPSISSLITWALFIYFLYDIIIALLPYKKKPLFSNKAFSKYFKPTQNIDLDYVSKQNKFALIIFVLYTLLIIGIGLLYLHFDFLDTWFIYLSFLLFNIADYICVLYWCPFQHLFMKNRCCYSCRISNWDRFMKYSILLFAPNMLANILASLSIFVLLEWEYLHYKHPKRFYSLYNKTLSCSYCQVKLCKY